MENQNLFFYGTSITTGRRVCLAGIINNGKLLIGKAECSIKDQFVKAKGRKMALGRANSKHAMECKVDTTDSTKQFANICKELVIPMKTKVKKVEEDLDPITLDTCYENN